MDSAHHKSSWNREITSFLWKKNEYILDFYRLFSRVLSLQKQSASGAGDLIVYSKCYYPSFWEFLRFSKQFPARKRLRQMNKKKATTSP